MRILSPNTPVQRKISYTMVVINLLAFVIVTQWAFCLYFLHSDGLIRDIGYLPSLFEALFASWIPSVAHAHSAALNAGDPTLAAVVLTIQSFTWLVFLMSMAALAIAFVRYWTLVIPTLPAEEIQGALQQKRRFDGEAAGLPFVRMTVGVILSLGLFCMCFFGDPSVTTASVVGPEFSLLHMPLTMLFTLLLASGTITLIFNLAIYKRLSRGQETAPASQVEPAFAA